MILGAGVAYVGLVASRKRWTTMRAVLADTGVNTVSTRYTTPQGSTSWPDAWRGGRLDPGGARPGRADERSGDAAAPEQTTASAPAFAVDPVCGMQVEIAGARHVADVNGTVYYFCCANCRLRFLKEPQQFAATRGSLTHKPSGRDSASEASSSMTPLRPRCSSCSRSKSPSSSKVLRAWARPRAPRSSRTCSARG